MSPLRNVLNQIMFLFCFFKVQNSLKTPTTTISQDLVEKIHAYKSKTIICLLPSCFHRAIYWLIILMAARL